MREPSCFAAKVAIRKVTPVTLRLWPVEAGNETEFNRVAAASEHDGNSGGRRLSRDASLLAAGCSDDCHATTSQISRQFRWPIVLAFRPAKFDGDVAPLDVTHFAEAVTERDD